MPHEYLVQHYVRIAEIMRMTDILACLLFVPAYDCKRSINHALPLSCESWDAGVHVTRWTPYGEQFRGIEWFGVGAHS